MFSSATDAMELLLKKKGLFKGIQSAMFLQKIAEYYQEHQGMTLEPIMIKKSKAYLGIRSHVLSHQAHLGKTSCMDWLETQYDELPFSDMLFIVQE
jgi:hypothetical protein